jgi:hypothetical protein
MIQKPRTFIFWQVPVKLLPLLLPIAVSFMRFCGHSRLKPKRPLALDVLLTEVAKGDPLTKPSKVLLKAVLPSKVHFSPSSKKPISAPGAGRREAATYRADSDACPHFSAELVKRNLLVDCRCRAADKNKLALGDDTGSVRFARQPATRTSLPVNPSRPLNDTGLRLS